MAKEEKAPVEVEKTDEEKLSAIEAEVSENAHALPASSGVDTARNRIRSESR